MDWPRPGALLHTTGLWGRSYLGVGRRAASRAWQKTLSKRRHRFTVRETLQWKNTHMGLPKGNQAIRTPSPVQGLTGDPGELTPVLGLASDCSVRSDCRGCLEELHQGSPTGELNWRRNRQSHPRMRGEWRNKHETRQFDCIHNGQPLFGDSLPFLLTSVVDKELLSASEAPGALQPFLQERKHYSNRASSGVFSARRTPVCEQTPLQCIGLPCWRSSGLSDGLYHCQWWTAQVCCVPSRSHTWRFHRSGCGCHMVPSPWERRSFLRGMRQGGAVTRKIIWETRSALGGQYVATTRTCSSSSLILHSVCASRLTGGNAYLRKAWGQLCASASVPRGSTRGRTRGLSGRSRGKQTGLPKLPRIDSRSAELSRDGVPILRGTWAVMRAHRPHVWASLGCGQHAGIWAACDSRVGDDGRAVTCDVIVYLPAGWCTSHSVVRAN